MTFKMWRGGSKPYITLQLLARAFRYSFFRVYCGKVYSKSKGSTTFQSSMTDRVDLLFTERGKKGRKNKLKTQFAAYVCWLQSFFNSQWSKMKKCGKRFFQESESILSYVIHTFSDLITLIWDWFDFEGRFQRLLSNWLLRLIIKRPRAFRLWPLLSLTILLLLLILLQGLVELKGFKGS